jgi:hypothetical protein
MNGTYGIKTRGDPPLRFGARGDPRVVNSLRDDSFEMKLIPNRITGRNGLNGRGMPGWEMGRRGENENGRWGEEKKWRGAGFIRQFENLKMRQFYY